MKQIIVSLLFILFGDVSLVAQLRYTFTQFGDETVDFVKLPVQWEGTDWLTLGFVGAGTVLLIETADQPLRTAVLKDRRYFNSVPIEFGRLWGEIYTPIVLFGGFAVHSLITNDISTRKIAYEIGQASLYAGVITYALKLMIGRARPYTNEGNTSFHPFPPLWNKDYHALPGGHNAAAFVLSTVLSRNASPLWLKILAYLPAALTFVSRAYQDQHWISDDFLGAAIGYFVATWVVNKHENIQPTGDMSSMYPLSLRIAF